ncbi:MAG TPA: hypothetical protein GXX33_01845 [Firmicutes bacterium]|nr:hypothetical protein [Bacillota bacterium]
MRIAPWFHLKRYERLLLLGITLVSFLKCLIFPNALDVILLVGLLLLDGMIFLGNGKGL